jgi:hypothetical protein
LAKAGNLMSKPVIAVAAVVAVGVLFLSPDFRSVSAFDPNTVTCTDTSLSRQAEGLIQGLESPLLGKINILKAMNYRDNPAYGTAAKDLSDLGGHVRDPDQTGNDGGSEAPMRSRRADQPGRDGLVFRMESRVWDYLHRSDGCPRH